MRLRVPTTGLMLVLCLLARPVLLSAASNSAVEATVKVSVCGNGVTEGGEECDGGDLAGKTCATQGFASGVLACLPACVFDTLLCVAGGGGGGGGGSVTAASVVLYGWAYPYSTVTILKDSQLAATTTAGADARFLAVISGLVGGNYSFSVYAYDDKGVRSVPQTSLVAVTAGTAGNVTGILIPPTIAVDKATVAAGDKVIVTGRTVPKSTVTMTVGSTKEISADVAADASGGYEYAFSTVGMSPGVYHAKSRTSVEGAVSAYAGEVAFKVGASEASPLGQGKPSITGDLNADGRVNLVDFSILAYWYKRSIPPALVDLNVDGKVDLVDLSIMAFNWTG